MDKITVTYAVGDIVKADEPFKDCNARVDEIVKRKMGFSLTLTMILDNGEDGDSFNVWLPRPKGG